MASDLPPSMWTHLDGLDELEDEIVRSPHFRGVHGALLSSVCEDEQARFQLLMKLAQDFKISVKEAINLN
jgi:hypothetical protein